MSGSWRGRRSEKTTQLNISHGDQKYLLVPDLVLAVEIPQNKEISGGEVNGREKESVLLSVEEEQIAGA